MMSEEKQEAGEGSTSTPVPVVTGTLVVDAQGSGYVPPPSATMYSQQYRFASQLLHRSPRLLGALLLSISPRGWL